MRRAFAILAFIAMAVMVSPAQNGGYLLINNDSFSSNSADIDTVSPSGALVLLTTVQTGGTGLGGGFFNAPRNAVEKNLQCFFVADGGSSDIASFHIPSLRKVPANFSNSTLSGQVLGIGLAASPNGKFLYSAWSGSNNIAVLSIASDCSLTLVGSPISQPDNVIDITITKDGRALVVSYPNLGGAQAYSLNPNTGTMTPLGPQLVFDQAISECASVCCFPTAEDVDNTGQYWVWGNAVLSVPSILTAKLTTHGFTNAAVQTFPNSGAANVESPWFSPAGRAGNGNLYLGAMGFGRSYPAGIIVATFNAGTITDAGSTLNSAAYYAGNVQTIGKTGTGSPITQIWNDSIANNTVQSYTVDGTTLTPASSLKTTSSGSFAFSTNGVGK
jgi:6-phosphogluconolactonase (cycloisomerase 2 family)